MRRVWCSRPLLVVCVRRHGLESALSRGVEGVLAPIKSVDLRVLVTMCCFGLCLVMSCRGQRREETFENVLRNPLTFPSKPAISPEAQDLISKLLIKDPLQRLGTRVRFVLCAAGLIHCMLV